MILYGQDFWWQNLILYIFVGFFGACLGSFAAVIIYRVSANINWVHRPSFCEQCQKVIPFLENIPIFSFIILRGHCSSCRHFIGWRLLIIEIIFALSFACLYVKYGISLAFLDRVLLFFLLVVISYIDMDSFVLPLGLLLLIIGLGVASTVGCYFFPQLYPPIDHFDSWIGFMVLPKLTSIVNDRLLGAIFLCVVLLLINLIFTWIFRATKRISNQQWAMGFGDPLLAFGLGLFVGLSHSFMLLFLASFFGSLVGIAAQLCRGLWMTGDKDIPTGAIPFGPFLSLAAIYIYLL
jgi:leader peptidase (prepilin peptidase)/N-methyltransferase